MTEAGLAFVVIETLLMLSEITLANSALALIAIEAGGLRIGFALFA